MEGTARFDLALEYVINTYPHPGAMPEGGDWYDIKPDHRPHGSSREKSNHLELTIVKPDDSRMVIKCKEIQVRIERRLQRTILRGGEGDDMEDQGSESALYLVTAKATLEQYLELIEVFRGDQPRILEPFEGGEIKVAFSNISYNASKGELKTEIIQDIA